MDILGGGEGGWEERGGEGRGGEEERLTRKPLCPAPRCSADEARGGNVHLHHAQGALEQGRQIVCGDQALRSRPVIWGGGGGGGQLLSSGANSRERE